MRPPITGMESEVCVSAGLDMGGHVVRPFGAVFQITHGRIVRRWHEAAEEGFQIGLHIGIRILLHQKGAGRMLAEQGQQPIAACGV